MNKPGLIHEQDGATSSRRFLACLSFTNAIALSWKGADWQIVALFIAAALILLGLTTISDIKGLVQYKLADAVSGGATVSEGEESESIGFKGN